MFSCTFATNIIKRLLEEFTLSPERKDNIIKSLNSIIIDSESLLMPIIIYQEQKEEEETQRKRKSKILDILHYL